MTTTFWILLSILGVVVLWFIAIYNGFIRLITRAKEAWADIDVQLKRRYDLIPNLMETVKGYAAHEKGILERVTQLRVQAMAAQGVEKRGEIENILTASLKTLFAVSENYPQLKANENFLELQRELSDTENKIQAARRFYNTNVRDLNIKTDSFPSNLIAKIFNFSKMEFFELEEEAAKEPVKVNF
ncbi:MAG: LemA family protein [Candidatus Terrybacteria bacterium]|nr:LemA family protein [Candidatus Terrybacteria bacterium]